MTWPDAYGAFEDSEEDSGAIVEEFYPAATDDESNHEVPTQRSASTAKPTLAAKLESKAQQIGTAH